MRLFVAPADLVAGELEIRGGEHHYLARVRRARGGEIVELVDGAGRRARGVIARITDAVTVVVIDPPEEIVALPPVVRALIPVIKGDRMDDAIEKLVEVGVDAIVVWPAARAVVKLDAAKRETRIAHYQAAAQAAARQSGRAAVPAVSWAPSLGSLVALRGFVLDPASDRALELAPGVGEVSVISGPEGGFAPEELTLLSSWTSIGLGPRVLRADTAPVVAVALVRHLTRS